MLGTMKSGTVPLAISLVWVGILAGVLFVVLIKY
jgi:hypothetical protein